MGQTRTGQITEQRVRDKLKSLGLQVEKPYPDEGVDLIAWNPDHPDIKVKIQVKGRNPKKDPNLRWFQIRVTPKQLEAAELEGLHADDTWKEKVRKTDFFVLDAVKVNEMYVMGRDKIFELIKDNEQEYIHRKPRSDNFFNYERPLKQKQKEMNLDIEVGGVMLREKYSHCRDNFDAIKSFLENRKKPTTPKMTEASPNRTQKITDTELDKLFQDEALHREAIAREKCGHRPGRYQMMAAEEGALNAAIKLINRTEPSEGLTRLFDCERNYKGARNLSIEQIYVEFAEKYGSDYPSAFPREVVEKAKRKLGLL